MIQNLNSQLLLDLAKCIKKHSPEDFRAVAAALSDPQLCGDVAKMLEELASVSRRIKDKKAAKKPKGTDRATEEAKNWGKIIMKGKNVA